MNACGFSQELLSAWIDGEAAEQAQKVEVHLGTCATCSAQVEAMQAASKSLCNLIDEAVGNVEPLFSLTRIRARIEQQQARSPWAKLALWWREVWAYNRRAAAGVAIAMALGMLSAPLLAMWAAAHGHQSNRSLAVVVESMEWQGKDQAVVYQAESGATTLIWVQPDGARGQQDLQDTH